jgi:hypothetical protein
MKKIYIVIACWAVILLSACSRDENKTSGSNYVLENNGKYKVWLNATIQGSNNTRLTETETGNRATYLKASWDGNDKLAVLLKTSLGVETIKYFHYDNTPGSQTYQKFVADNDLTSDELAGFNSNPISAVNFSSASTKIAVPTEGSSSLTATENFTGQDGTAGNIANYDLLAAYSSNGMGGVGTALTFYHQTSVLRIRLISSVLSTSSPVTITNSGVISQSCTYSTPQTDNLLASTPGIDISSLSLTPSEILDNDSTIFYIAVPSRPVSAGSMHLSTNSNSAKITINKNIEAGKVYAKAVNLIDPYANAQVGDFITSDGTIIKHITTSGSTYGCPVSNPGTIVGIVTSLSPTDDAKAAGYTHGYAMALTTNDAKMVWSSTYSYTFGTPVSLANAISDNKGYEWTNAIKSATDYAGHYEAAHAAIGYAPAPSSSSGWFLPAVGQFYQMWINLCHTQHQPTVSSYYGTKQYSLDNYNDWVNIYNLATNIASYNHSWSILNSDRGILWTSSYNTDSGIATVCSVEVNNGDMTVNNYDNLRSWSNSPVRPFLAF